MSGKTKKTYPQGQTFSTRKIVFNTFEERGSLIKQLIDFWHKTDEFEQQRNSCGELFAGIIIFFGFTTYSHKTRILKQQRITKVLRINIKCEEGRYLSFKGIV